MDVVNYSTARQNLAGLMDTVTQDRTANVVTRQGAEDVVILSKRAFDGWPRIQRRRLLSVFPGSGNTLEGRD